MDFHNYHDNANEYYWTPYSNTSNYYDIVPPPQSSSPTYSPYESTQPNYNHFEYDYESGMNQEMNFYRHNFSETQLIQYQPAPYEIGYVSSNPIMYSVASSTKKVRFILPDFDEYDPTPYGGGYDADQYYGKPLPPSDKVCYPRTEPPKDGGVSLEGFSFESIPCPYGKNEETPSSRKQQNHENSSSRMAEKPKIQENDDGKHSAIDVPELVLEIGEEVDDSSSVSDGENADDDDDAIEEVNERQLLNIPYGSGLESMDICESIFGYWPCLEKMKREENQKLGGSSEESYNDPWKSAADYLFGGPFGYGEQKDGGNYAFHYGNNYNYHG